MVGLSDADKEFITANFPDNYSIGELVVILNRTTDQIKHYVYKSGLGAKGRSRYWSKGKLQWLYDHRIYKPKVMYMMFLEDWKVPTTYENVLNTLGHLKKKLKDPNFPIVRDKYPV